MRATWKLDTNFTCMILGNVLEVYDLPPGITRADADKLLKDLVTNGAHLQFIHQENVQYQNDTGTATFQKILAIFPTSLGANQILQTHSSISYKLRPSSLENIGVRT